MGLHYFKESLEQINEILPSLSVGKNSRETKSVYMGLEYAFLQHKIIWHNLKLFSALRYQKYFTHNADMYPSFGMSYVPLYFKEFNFSAHWAKSVRYPDFNSLFWKGGVQSQGNPDLLPEKKTGWNLSLIVDFNKSYMPYFYVLYFYEKLSDLIFWEQIRNNHWQPRNLSNAEKEGWDIQLKQKIITKQLSLRVSYSRVDALNKSKEPLVYNKYLVLYLYYN